MKVVVQHDASRYRYLKKYTSSIYHLSETYKIVDVNQQHLARLKRRIQYVEPNFPIELCKVEGLGQNVLNDNMLLITIGALHKDSRIDATYNMGTHTLKRLNKSKDANKYRWVHCYNFDNKADAVKYIQCIRFLCHFVTCQSKPAIIYANVYIDDERYRFRSLTNKVISEYLDKLKGILIVKKTQSQKIKDYKSFARKHEFYIDKAIYLDENLNDAIKKVKPFIDAINNKMELEEIGKGLRQSRSLYVGNIFYDTIDEEEEIYVVLATSSYRSPEEYTKLGLSHVPLIGGYGMLYGKKKMFDELSDELKYDVTYPYYIPILSHPRCEKIINNSGFSYQFTSEDLKYKGKDVYIGVVSVDDVDYTQKVLKTPDGKTRIAYIWNQIKADEGNSYYKEDVDSELTSENPGSRIPLPEAQSMSTMMLALAGGSSSEPNYHTIATESEFLVAKIQPASEKMQRIFGGMPSKYAVSIADVLIGVIKLMTFAAQAKKPLVICIPFNTNLDPHDGTVPLYAILQVLATQAGVAIIAPAGDEADKMHHSDIVPSSSGIATINIDVQRTNQNVVGILYQDFPNLIDVSLYPPKNISSSPINLKAIDVTNLGGTTIYTSGYRISPLNGSVRMLFRFENPYVGNWRMVFNTDTSRVSKTDLWISQKELNEFITLSPSDAFTSIGSTACIKSIIVVGGYDQNNMVPVISTGRGFTRDNREKPDFLTNVSHVIAPCFMNEWVSITGTIPAASIITGVVATLFSKYADENIFPLPNSLVINSVLLSRISQIGDGVYPNPTYGYGVFDLKVLGRLLEDDGILVII